MNNRQRVLSEIPLDAIAVRKLDALPGVALHMLPAQEGRWDVPEEYLAGIKERLSDTGKMSRNEYVSLQNTVKDLEVRLNSQKQKLHALTDAANKANVPADIR